MTLAVVTGHGALADSVIHHVDAARMTYRHYHIAQWLWKSPFDFSFSSNKELRSIDPFNFSALSNAISDDGISSMILAGQLPKTRMAQIRVNNMFRHLWNSKEIGGIGDKLLQDLFLRQDSNLITPVRYIAALESLFKHLSVSLTQTISLFPQLHVEDGDDVLSIDNHFLSKKWPTIKSKVEQKLTEASTRGNSISSNVIRPPQTVIIDSENNMTVESSGTNDLIDNHKELNYENGSTLVKLPCPFFNTAIDQPTLGDQTIHHAKNKGIKRIIFSRAETRLVNKNHMIALSRDAGIDLIYC
jgi:DUF1009 family protein